MRFRVEDLSVLNEQEKENEREREKDSLLKSREKSSLKIGDVEEEEEEEEEEEVEEEDIGEIAKRSPRRFTTLRLPSDSPAGMNLLLGN
ncbi:hypothetical protein HZH68_007389 [Vespula germanica]|uniref:Uncharacterized protein n=1 Tax=Vespula germanica TaxID=30212 RepID=A0A834NB19_VESGE|nr:hypothetical protein HZH68_007389 [Vespula germanica]